MIMPEKMYLKNCPFCNSKHVFGRMESVNDWPNYYVIQCDDCGAFMTFMNDDDQSIGDVINRYNRRGKE